MIPVIDEGVEIVIKIICDKCGCDCIRVGYHVDIQIIHNPTPIFCTDLGDLKITDDHIRVRFCLCQDCYRSLGLPNIYIAERTHELRFREEDVSKENV